VWGGITERVGRDMLPIHPPHDGHIKPPPPKPLSPEQVCWALSSAAWVCTRARPTPMPTACRPCNRATCPPPRRPRHPARGPTRLCPRPFPPAAQGRMLRGARQRPPRDRSEIRGPSSSSSPRDIPEGYPRRWLCRRGALRGSLRLWLCRQGSQGDCQRRSHSWRGPAATAPLRWPATTMEVTCRWVGMVVWKCASASVGVV
jgi:hypothetical protein